MELHVPALIPESYLADVASPPHPLQTHRQCQESTESLRELQVEMIDRFGLLPQAIKALFEIAELRLIAERDWYHEAGLSARRVEEWNFQ